MHAESDNVVFFEIDCGICCILSDGPSEYNGGIGVHKVYKLQILYVIIF